MVAPGSVTSCSQWMTVSYHFYEITRLVHAPTLRYAMYVLCRTLQGRLYGKKKVAHGPNNDTLSTERDYKSPLTLVDRSRDDRHKTTKARFRFVYHQAGRGRSRHEELGMHMLLRMIGEPLTWQSVSP